MWISAIYVTFKTWCTKVTSLSVSYDEIELYVACSTKIGNLLDHEQTIHESSLAIDLDFIQTIKNTFLTEFELLNVYLLRYIPQHPDAKWCTFPALLSEYGVTLPQDLFSTIQNNIVFPEKENTTGDELLTHPPPAGTSGKFQPGQDITLKLTKKFTLKELSSLVQKIEKFQQPLSADSELKTFISVLQAPPQRYV